MVRLVLWTVFPRSRRAILAPSAAFEITLPVMRGRRRLGLILRIRVARVLPRQALLLSGIQIDTLVRARNARLGAMFRASATSRTFSASASALLDGTLPIDEACRFYFFVVRVFVAICGVRDTIFPAQPVPVLVARHAFLSVS